MRLWGIFAAIMLWAGTVMAQDYSNNWSVLAGGGGQAESSGNSAQATFGQGMIGVASSNDYTVRGGFWLGPGVGNAGGCQYIAGDYNGNQIFNVADIIAAFSFLQTGSPQAAYLCECPPGGGIEWAVAMDLNNTCVFNIADVITGFSKLQTGSPELVPCEACPPSGP